MVRPADTYLFLWFIRAAARRLLIAASGVENASAGSAGPGRFSARRCLQGLAVKFDIRNVSSPKFESEKRSPLPAWF